MSPNRPPSAMMITSHCNGLTMEGYYAAEQHTHLSAGFYPQEEYGDPAANFEETLSDHNSGRFLLTHESHGKGSMHRKRTFASPAELWLV